jgi:hypothetical protein
MKTLQKILEERDLTIEKLSFSNLTEKEIKDFLNELSKELKTKK